MSKQHFLNPLRVTAIVIGALCFASSAAGQTKLLRFPDIHGDRVVFTYGGDLWTASASGGSAIRLTSHPGMEVFGKFSPDGKWIAFTGQYDGDEQVYVVAATGGVPRQLTFYPAKGPLTPRWGWDNHVHGWSRDGKRILFRSQRDSWALPIAKLYTVSVEGGPAEDLADADRRLGRLFTRRRTDGLFTAVARFPFRETLRRRSGKRSLHLRSENLRGEEDY